MEQEIFLEGTVDTPEGPPTPQTPFQCPHPNKKGTNLLFFE
jgi:hypothetical protein